MVSKLSENPSTAPFTPSFLESHLFEFSASTDQQFVFLVGTCDENQSRAQPNNNKKTLHTKKNSDLFDTEASALAQFRLKKLAHNIFDRTDPRREFFQRDLE